MVTNRNMVDFHEMIVRKLLVRRMHVSCHLLAIQQVGLVTRSALED